MRAHLLLGALLAWAAAASSAEIVFPPDRDAVIDVKRDCGAQGDGIAEERRLPSRPWLTWSLLRAGR